jgi:hypothetical protein
MGVKEKLLPLHLYLNNKVRIASAPKFRPLTLELKKNHMNRHTEHKTEEKTV